MVRAYLAVILTTALWAVNIVVAKIATSELDPLFIAPFRILMTAAVFYPMLPREERKIRASDWKAILPLAVLGMAANQLCFASGIKLTTPSHSAVIHMLLPVFVAGTAWLVLRETLSGRALVGMALALGGALIVVLGNRRVEPQGVLMGDLITAVGIVAFSIYMVFGRKVMATMGSRRMVTLAFLFSSPVMAPLLVWGAMRQDWSIVTVRGWIALAYMWIFANMIAYLLHSYSLARLKAGQVAAFTNLQPAIAIGVSALAGERLTGTLLAGSAVALAGVILVQLRR